MNINSSLECAPGEQLQDDAASKTRKTFQNLHENLKFVTIGN